ncbi:hypothetical protein BC828DRAFT_407361 [Blastocladiella britannica]|nr:hypothetical protein BC828DRAFT_407361 [Blastocladiella britannica]
MDPISNYNNNNHMGMADPLLVVPMVWIDHIVALLSGAFPQPEGVTSETTPLRMFVLRVVRLSSTSLPTLVMAHVYLSRLVGALAKRTAAGPAARPQHHADAPHRVFLAALLVAAKLAHDPPSLPSGESVVSSASSSPMSNVAHESPATSAAALAAVCGGAYSPREVMAMERALCKALAHRLWVPAARLAEHVRGICAKAPVLAHYGGDALLAALEAELELSW